VLFPRLFALILCAALAACSKSETPQQAADRFFSLCAQGKIDEAYQSAATRFRLERSDKYFEARVRELALDQDNHPAWDGNEKRGKAVVLAGTFKPPGSELGISRSVTMIEENGAWRVLEVRQSQAGGQGSEDIFQVKTRAQDGGLAIEAKPFLEPVRTVIPTEDQLRILVEETILKFNACIKAGDFKSFYDFVSNRWKFRGVDPARGTKNIDFNNTDQRLTVTALNLQFRRFLELHVDLSPVKGKALILDKPAFITSAGVLTLDGTFDTFVFIGTEPPTPRKLKFQLQYVMEANSWRVFGISLSLPE
jgi:hypothetical protein